jgi:hypothetical protein
MIYKLFTAVIINSNSSITPLTEKCVALVTGGQPPWSYIGDDGMEGEFSETEVEIRTAQLQRCGFPYCRVESLPDHRCLVIGRLSPQEDSEAK